MRNAWMYPGCGTGMISRERQQAIKEAWITDALVEAIPLEQEGIDIVVILGRSFEE